MFCFRRALSLVLLGSLIFGDAVALVHTGVYHRDSCCDAHQACGTGPTAVSDPHASCQEQHRSCAHASVDETAAAEEPCGDPSTVPHDYDSCVICRWLAHPQAPEVPDGSTMWGFSGRPSTAFLLPSIRFCRELLIVVRLLPSAEV